MNPKANFGNISQRFARHAPGFTFGIGVSQSGRAQNRTDQRNIISVGPTGLKPAAGASRLARSQILYL
jgi:hypothetical protein